MVGNLGTTDKKLKKNMVGALCFTFIRRNFLLTYSASTLIICKSTSRVRQNSLKFKTFVFLLVPKSPIEICFVSIKNQEYNSSCLSPFKSKTRIPRRSDQNSALRKNPLSAITNPKTTFANIDVPES